MIFRSSGSYGIFQTGSAVRILADTDGGQLYPQNCFPNSVRIVRVFGMPFGLTNAGNVPSRNEPHSTTTSGRMRGGVPGRHTHLLARHEAARRTPATRLRNSSTRTILRQTVQERIRPEKGPILGHMVSAQGVHVDPKKIEAVRTWKTPENVKELQQFLGFANYYNRFVPQYAKLAAPLTNLLKKNTPYKWETKHQEAVEQLKQALTSAPVLILPDPERDYVIEADASDQAVGSLDARPGEWTATNCLPQQETARGRTQLPDTRQRGSCIIAFKAWRCYLEGRRTTVYTDHCSLKYLKTQPNLSRRQVRWIDFLETHFHYDIVYKPGHKNKADALSRPAHVADSEKRHLLQWDSDIAYRKGSTKIWVPNYPPLRQLLLEEYHDVLYAGHFGSNKTLTGIAKHYYWPHMADDVQKFVTSCDTCQRMKSSKQKKAGYCSLFLSQNNHGKWLAWTSSPGYHLPPAVMTPSLSSLTSSPKWDTSSRHTRRHAPRRQHNSSFVTSSHSMASQLHSSPTETPSSPASSGRNLCLCSAPNSPCHPHTIRRQTDRPSASTKLLSNSSEQPARTTSPNGTCTCPY
ncbi:hypothetical protein CLOP_g2063 [Closterium sp. NIES-67]|nr:hypothetical protein CLOP_g2063 [Closterium sp. NIES-67]